MMDNKLSELSKPVAWKLHHHDRYYFEENADVVAIAESFGQAKGDAVYSQEYVSALIQRAERLDSMLTESVQALKAAAQRNAELELRLAVEIEPPPVIYPGRYDCHAMHSAIRRAGFRVSGDSEHVGDVDMRDERALAAVSDKQRIAELEARLATPVQLLDARTERDYEQTEKWNGPDPYCMGHLDGWNANRLEQSALLKKQGFRVEGDE